FKMLPRPVPGFLLKNLRNSVRGPERPVRWLGAADESRHEARRYAADLRCGVPIAQVLSRPVGLSRPAAEIAEIAMLEFFLRLFDTNGFPPRWGCGDAWAQEPAVGWMHIVSDLTVFAAYTAIPVMLLYFVFHKKTGSFLPIFWLFAVFILAC